MATPDPRMQQAAAGSAAVNNRILLSPGRRNSGGLQHPMAGDSAASNQRLALPGYRELSQAMRQADPAAARQVVRDFFAKCLLGSDFHSVFVTSLMLSNASQAALDQSIRDHGNRVISSCKQQVASCLTGTDLDTLGDSILAKASSAFLDNALARRLETIPARALVNALARAERLGYDFQDVVEEQPGSNGAEHVFPSMGSNALNSMPAQNDAASTPSSGLRRNASSLQRQPQQASPLITTSMPARKQVSGPHGIRYCQKCGRPCSGTEALLVHTQKDACRHTANIQGLGSHICIHCGCLFTSPGGLTYHQKHKVCGHFSEEAVNQVLAEIQSLGAQGRAEASAIGTPQAKAPAASSPAPAGVQSSNSHHTALAQTPKDSTPGTANAPGSAEVDPYGKLSAEDKEALEREMDHAAKKYGSLIQEAMKKTDIHDSQRELMVSRYKNSYNTKQSMIRKKYGIRLRERRPRAQIELDRKRLLGLYMENSNSGDEDGDVRTRGHVSGRNADTDSPRSAAAIKEAQTAKTSGGLMASSGTAAFTDPTMVSKSPTRSAQTRSAPQPYFATAGTVEDPMDIDDGASNDNSSSSDDGDIPAQLAGHI